MILLLIQSRKRLFTLFFSLFIFSVLGNSQNLDTLSKYSYLIIEASSHAHSLLEIPNEKNFKFEGNASGFFIRDSGKVFLYTAYHVFSSCDLFGKRNIDSKVEYFIIRCFDKENNPRYIVIPVKASLFAKLPCWSFLERADFVAIDVTNYLGDVEVCSIESIIKQKRVEKKLYSDTIVCYGYPTSKISEFKSTANYDDYVRPSQYVGKVDTNFLMKEYDRGKLDSLYLTATPASSFGTSGAPVFIQQVGKHKKWIEFAGIQSSTNFNYDQSLITKGELFSKFYRQGKR